MRLLTSFLVAVLLLFTLVSAEDFCGADSNATMFDPESPLPQTGGMTYLKFGLARAWPEVNTSAGKIRLIRYCYANAAAKQELDCAVQAGFNIWSEAIGSPASAQNGHSLGWKQLHDGNSDKTKRKYHYCYLDDYKNRQEPGTWNPAVAIDALAIRLSEETPVSTIGWDATKLVEAGRHKMILPAKIPAAKVAHEELTSATSSECTILTAWATGRARRWQIQRNARVRTRLGGNRRRVDDRCRLGRRRKGEEDAARVSKKEMRMR
jgi:hypothetical protein